MDKRLSNNFLSRYSNEALSKRTPSNDIALRDIALLEDKQKQSLFEKIQQHIQQEYHCDEVMAVEIMQRDFSATLTALGKTNTAANPMMVAQPRITKSKNQQSLLEKYKNFYASLHKEGSLTQTDLEVILGSAAMISEYNADGAIVIMNRKLESIHPDLANRLEMFGRSIGDRSIENQGIDL